MLKVTLYTCPSYSSVTGSNIFSSILKLCWAGFLSQLFCGELICISKSSIILRRLYYAKSTFLRITTHNSFNVKFTSPIFVCVSLHEYVQTYLFLIVCNSQEHTKKETRQNKFRAKNRLDKKAMGVVLILNKNTGSLLTILGRREESSGQNVLTIGGLWHCLADYGTPRIEIHGWAA